MFFGKKKEEKKNPYYQGEAAHPLPAPQPAVQPQAPPQQPLVPPQRPLLPQPEQKILMPVPLIPAPESVISAQTRPMKTDGSLSESLQKFELSTSKPFAFVKLSNFKQLLDDIKLLESQVQKLQEDLEKLNDLTKAEEDAMRSHAIFVDSLKKVISDIYSSLSNVQE